MIQRIRRGFTLIEVMIVVAIIGILAAIAIPNFIKFQCRSKQSEAKTNLKSIYVGQVAYHGENDTYLAVAPASFLAVNELSVQMVGNTRYSYTTTGLATVFLATADGKTAMTGDQWTMTQGNVTSNVTNSCD